jgi:23S rRNA pseudouridine1911/1915/1917 synthase
MSQTRIRKSVVTDAATAGWRLDRVAAELFPEFSRARLQRWIRAGELTVDGEIRKPTYRICGGEALRLDAAIEPVGEVVAQEIPLDIIHADADLIVLDKPAGLVVHPAAGNPDGTLQNALLHFDANLAVLPRAGIVHRLDKDTSGVMVVARSLRAHTSLVDQLQTRTMSRVYRAVALGEPPGEGTVDAPIGRHPRDRKRMAVVAGGRPAISHYRVLQRYGFAAYLEVSLESGRTHQIRVHMAHIGHPLLGDPVYGRRLKKSAVQGVGEDSPLFQFDRQALHAEKLALLHPADGERVRFRAPLPQDFSELLAAAEAAAS